MNKVVVSVDDFARKEFTVDGEPKTEKDLTQYKEYMDFCYKVGLGAPVVAEVTVSTGWFSSKKYSFSYTMRGNSISYEELMDILERFKDCSECEVFDSDMTEGKHHLVYSFSDNSAAFSMYKQVQGICNIGAYHGMSNDIGAYVVVIDYFMIQ